jgi:glycine C-acetyltransferase
MEDLEQQLIKERSRKSFKILTDGVFSMDGLVAPLDKIVILPINMMQWLWLTKCHAAGFIGYR